MFGKILCAGAVSVSVFVAGGGIASAAQRGSCSTSGLAVASLRYKVVGLTTSGVPCAKARSVAQTVAGELAHGKPLSLSGGVQGFAINTTMCGGCRTTTQVALTYATGKVTISLGGAPSSFGIAPSPIVPPVTGPLINA